MTRLRVLMCLVFLILAAVVGVATMPMWVGLAGPMQAEASTGVMTKITNVEIPADRKPVITFKLTDAQGRPLQLGDMDTESVRFTIARIDQSGDTGQTQYVSYVLSTATGRPFQMSGETVQPVLGRATQATLEMNGIFTSKGDGVYTYTMATALPADFPQQATHVLGMQATKEGRRWVGNDVFYFVPAGGAPQVMRQIVTTAGCNRCHDQLAFHGGTRRDVNLCVLCHTPQTTDPESSNTVDFKVLIHKLHNGANLQSVKAGQPYFIVGNAQNVFDYTKSRWPQDVRNCQTCHVGPQGENWKTQPSAAACGSCHDRVNFSTGEGHLAGPQPDTACKTCHTSSTAAEFDLSIPGAHVVPEKSRQMRGVNFEIVSFMNTRPGQSPTVVFNVKDNAGVPIAPSEMAGLSLVLSGPTTDYSQYWLESAARAAATGDGNYSYTFQAKLPADAGGTYAVGISGFLTKDLTKYSGKVVRMSAGYAPVRDSGFSKVAYAAVGDPIPMPRKRIVDANKCNVCHEDLRLHGTTRKNTEFCVLCHNPNNTDIDKRTTAKGPMPPESVNFNWLIHRLHTGERLNEKPYIIYGGPANDIHAIDLSEAIFPTDRRNCTKCHVEGSNLLQFMRKDVLPKTVRQGSQVVSVTPPIQTACTGCHDSGPSKAHADTQTASGGREACLVCHNEGRDFSVSKVHRR